MAAVTRGTESVSGQGSAPRPPRGLLEAHVVTALACLAAAAVWMAVEPGMLAGYFYTPRVMGFTHLVTLGWLSTFALGVLLRAGPQFLGTPPVGRGLGWTVYVLWVIGASGIAFHMARGEWFGVWTAGSSLAVAVVLLFVAHRPIFARARGGDPAAAYAAVALINLALAMLLGMGIALNKHLELVGVDALRVLAAHVHLAAVGWLTLLILGFGRKLLPPLGSSPLVAAARLVAFEGALLALTGVLLAPPWWRAATGPAALLLAAVIWWHIARPVGRLLSGRVRDRASGWASAALLMLGLDTLLGVSLAWGAHGSPDFPGGLYTAYAVLLLIGWVTAAITAFALKLFPMWIWQERFGSDYGKEPVPPMPGLVNRPLQLATGILLLAGPLLLALGAATGSLLTAVGARLTAAGVLCFLAQIARTASWLSRKRLYRPTDEDRARLAALRAAHHTASGTPGTNPGDS